MKPVQVLIVDDEEDMRDLVEIYLENSGYSCLQASSGSEAYIVLENEQVDIVILDIMMPEEDGFSVCENIRSFSQVPIIFLSAKGEEWDKVKALKLGGDDYIVKPFNPGELVARIEAVLRRTSSVTQDEKIYHYGSISVDIKARNVSVDGKIIPLTLKEYQLLLFLIEHHSQALSREQLLGNIWGDDYVGSLRTVDTHIKTLRMKLGVDYIQTIWGVGYKFEVQNA